MKLRINGKDQTTIASTIAELVKTLGYEGDFFAVALNRACVPRKNYAATAVKDGDEIEILSPMQGG
jgi:sulfur carrier protein